MSLVTSKVIFCKNLVTKTNILYRLTGVQEMMNNLKCYVCYISASDYQIIKIGVPFPHTWGVSLGVDKSISKIQSPETEILQGYELF